MSLLPENTDLGALRVVEVYAEHDFPIAFACQSDRGATYVATWVSETPSTTGWLYVQVGPSRLGGLRQKKISLRDAFLKAETGRVFKVSVPKREGGSEAISVEATSLSDDVLPTEDSLIDASEIVDELASEVLGSQDDAEVSISGSPVVQNEINIGFFGSLLRSIQDLANAYGQAILTGPTDRAPVGQWVEAMSRIAVPSAFVPGSFKLRLRMAAENQVRFDGFQSRHGDPAILEFIAQVVSGDIASADSNFYTALPRIRTHLYRVLDLVSKENADLTFRTKGNPFGVRLTAASAKTRMATFTQVIVNRRFVVGQLPGASTAKGRFELRASGKEYSGRTTPASKKMLSGIALDSRVFALIQNQYEIDLQAGQISTKSSLLGISSTTRQEDYEGDAPPQNLSKEELLAILTT